jgi:hypothetical protein
MADRHSAAPTLAPNDGDDIRIPMPGREAGRVSPKNNEGDQPAKHLANGADLVQSTVDPAGCCTAVGQIRIVLNKNCRHAT